jgi:hypothetical protein
MKSIIPVEVIISETEFHILQKLVMTTVDGNVCNITTNAIWKLFYILVASSKHVDYVEVSDTSLDPSCSK